MMNLLSTIAGSLHRPTLIPDARPASVPLPPSALPLAAEPSSDPPAAAAASSTAAPPATAGSTPHTPCAVTSDGGPAAAPAPKITLGILVSAWCKADSDASARVVRLGAMADTWIAEQARHASPAPRPSAASSIGPKAEGLHGEILRVSRIVAMSWVAQTDGLRARPSTCR